MAARGRKNSKNSNSRKASNEKLGMDGQSPMSGSKTPKPGLINTITTDSSGPSTEKNKMNMPSMISISRMSSETYDRIVESQDESRSSIAESDYSGTSSERARKREMRQSNVFLMKVIHGRIPNELLASRITSTDRENLSVLIPNLVVS